MIERIGYFKGLAIKANNVFEVYDKLPIHKDKIPTEECGDCFRASLIDGTLYVEKWCCAQKDFYPIVCTSNFTVKF